jgi:hypothetical protein
VSPLTSSSFWAPAGSVGDDPSRRRHRTLVMRWLVAVVRPLTRPGGPDQPQRDRRRSPTQLGLAGKAECRRRRTSVSRVQEIRVHGSMRRSWSRSVTTVAGPGARRKRPAVRRGLSPFNAIAPAP